MQQTISLKNSTKIIRQTFMPSFGSTNNNDSIRLFHLVDSQNQIFVLPFITKDLSFQFIINEYRKAIDYIDSEQSELVIKSIKSNKIIDPSQKLQLYKQEIQDTSQCYFAIYEQLITHNQEFIKKKNKQKVDKVLQLIQKKVDRFFLDEDLFEITIMSNLKSISIKVNPQETIDEVKCTISKMLDIDLNSFTLYFNNKRLQNLQATLEDYQIKKNDKLFMVYILKSGCFSASASIMVNPNESKNIKELKISDSIWSFNSKKAQFEEDFIETVHKTSLDYYLRVTFEDQTKVQCSPTHKFLAANLQWRDFYSQEDNRNNRLKTGDQILNFQKKAVKIVDIESIVLKKPEVFYHISIKNNHTFIVNTFVSHNTQIRIVNNKDGVQFMIDTNQKDTIADIKKKIYFYDSKYEVIEQMLFLGSKHLKDKESLTDYQLDYKNTTLRLLMQSKTKVIIHFIKQKKQYEFDIIKKQTIRQLKKRISENLKISVTHQILFVSNVELENHKILQNYPLQQNYNRISLIEVENDQITQTNAQRFQNNTQLMIRIKENDSIKVKYTTFKEMKVKQFIYCMVQGSNDSYSLMFGQHVLNPDQRLHEIQKLPFYTKEKIQGQVIRNYGRLSFYDYFVVNQPFDRAKMTNISANEEQQLMERVTIVQNELRDKININTLNSNFIDFQTFYKSIMYLSSESVFQELSQFLKYFKFEDKENAASLKGFNYCSVLTRSLSCLPKYIGETHKIIQNFKLSSYHSPSDLFYWNQFIPTFVDQAYVHSFITKKCTLFHIESLTGRQITLMSSKGQKEVVFLPFSCFYIEQIRVNQKYDEVWLTQVPTPLSFQKNIILSVDDKPKDNLKLVKNLQTRSFEVIQLITTEVAEVWMKQFGWFLRWKNINCKIVSDMVRYEKKRGQDVYQAGIDLLQCLYNTYGFTIPIIIFCNDVQAAQQNIIQRNINPNRIALVTKKIQQVIDFCISILN